MNMSHLWVRLKPVPVPQRLFCLLMSALVVFPQLKAEGEQALPLRSGSYQEITNAEAGDYVINEFRVSGDGSRVVLRVTEQITDANNCSNFRQQLRVIDADGSNERVILQGFTWRNTFNVCQTSLNAQYDISHDGSTVVMAHQESPSNLRWILSVHDVDAGISTPILNSLPHRSYGETHQADLETVGGQDHFKVTGDGTQVFFINSFGPYGPPGNSGDPPASGLTIYAVATNGEGAVALLSDADLESIPGVTSSAVHVMGAGGYLGTDETGSWLAATVGGSFPSANPARYVLRLDPSSSGPGSATVLLDLGDIRISGVSVSRDGLSFAYALYNTGDAATDGVFVQDSAMNFPPIRLSRPGSQVAMARPQLSADGAAVSYNIDLGGGSSPSIRWAATDGSLTMPLSQPSTRAANGLSSVSADGSTVFYMGAVMPDVSNAPLLGVNILRFRLNPGEPQTPAVPHLTAADELTLVRYSIFDSSPRVVDRTYFYGATGSNLHSMYSFPFDEQGERETGVRGFHPLGGIKDDGEFQGDATANDGIYTNTDLAADISLESDTVYLRAAVSTDEGTSAFTDFAIPVRDIVPPQAHFTGTPTEGDAPLTVTFTDLSVGDITRSEWLFQPGTGHVRNPEPPLTYTYQNPGVYTVSLVVSRDGLSDTEEKEAYITVAAPHEVNTYTVEFLDHDGTTLKIETVEQGGSATAPDDPVREGYTFIGWDGAFDNVIADLQVTALFEVATGSIEVAIEPPEAVAAGAHWRVGNGDWLESGSTVEDVQPGIRTVTFSEVEDWLTSDAQDVTVEAGETAEVTAAYLDFGIADVDRLLGLSLGGNVLTMEAAGITEDTEVYIGEEPAFLLIDESDVEEGVLVVETPSQKPGEYDLGLEDSENDVAYVYDEPFVYTANPFKEGADQFSGKMREIRDTPYGVTTAGGSLPVEGNALQPLEYETPEGIVIEVPVEALPENATGAYVVARSAEQANHIFEKDEPLPVPDERAPRSPYVDVHILVELDGSGEDYELAETEDAPVTLRFPHAVAPAGWEALDVGEMLSNLDERFHPLLPDPVEIQLSNASIVEVDEDWAVAEGEHFTVYGILGPDVDGDVTGSGQVNAQDIQVVINYVLGLPVDERYNADVNNDKTVDARDIQMVINVVLGLD